MIEHAQRGTFPPIVRSSTALVTSTLPVLYNGRFLGRPPTGVDRFALEMLAALARLDDGAMAPQIAVPTRAGIELPPELPTARLLDVGSRQGQLWEQLELSRAAKDRPLVSLCNTAPALRENQLVVIHDAAIAANPGNFSRGFRNWYRVLLTSLMRRSRVVASVSKFSADELTRYFGRRANGIEVVYESGEQILRAQSDSSVIERLGLTGRRYLLSVGNRAPNKNFIAVLQALLLLEDKDLLLVSAGGGNNRVFAGAQVNDARLVNTGFVTDGELRALYENAQCFVFPSLYEGFGLPPLEAMWCGCPVIVSNTSALPEICGDAALYCDPRDPETIAAQVRRLLQSPSLRAELREAGARHAAQFSWARSARQFSEILKARLS